MVSSMRLWPSTSSGSRGSRRTEPRECRSCGGACASRVPGVLRAGTSGSSGTWSGCPASVYVLRAILTVLVADRPRQTTLSGVSGLREAGQCAASAASSTEAAPPRASLAASSRLSDHAAEFAMADCRELAAARTASVRGWPLAVAPRTVTRTAPHCPGSRVRGPRAGPWNKVTAGVVQGVARPPP
jgi:hypothetical protein